MDHARRALLEPSVLPGPPAEETEVEDRSSVREATGAREDEMPIPSADETLTDLEILVVPSGVIASSSIPIQISPGASSSCGVKRTCGEITAVPNVPGESSGSDVKRARSESTALPSPSVVSSGSGVKRTHEKSTANDDEEQPPDTCPDFKPDCGPSRCGCCGR